MAGIMYLGNQMVTPVIIQGGVDTNKYDVLPYITFYGKDYVDFSDREKALTSEYNLIPAADPSKDYFGFGDKATIEDFSASSMNDVLHFNKFNGYDYYYYYADTENIKKVGTIDEYIFNGFVLSDIDRFTIKAKRVILNNNGSSTGTGAYDNPLVFQVGSLNVDNYYFDEDSSAGIVMDNTYIEVTQNINSKTLEFYKLEGTLGFFVRDGRLATYSFTLKSTEDFSGLTFLENNFYNVTIEDREDENYYYKDITLTPKTRSELITSGYSENEADALLDLFGEDFIDVVKTYEGKPAGREAYVNDDYEVIPLYYLYDITGNIKPTLIELAQKESILKTKSILSGNFGVGLNGSVTKVGTCYPVVKKENGEKGFVDITDGSFYPFVSVPNTITFNTNYEGCTFSYEIDGSPISETSNVVSVPAGSVLSYSITKPQEGDVKYSTVTGSIESYKDETINISLLRTYRITIATNYSGCSFYFNNVLSATNYSDIFEGTEVTCKVTKPSEGDIDYSTETQKITVSQDQTVTLNLLRTYSITISGITGEGYLWEKDDGTIQPSAGEWSITNPYYDWENITFEYIRYGKLPEGNTYYEYKEVVSNLLNNMDRTVPVGEIKSFTATGDYSRPNLTANGTLWSDPLAVDGAAYSSSYPAWKAFDGNASTYWRTASSSATLTITSQKPLVLSSMTFTFNSTSTTPSFVSVYGLVKNQDNTVSSMFLKKQGQTYGNTTITVDLQYKPQGFYGYAVTFERSSGTCYVKEVAMVGKELQENT